MSRVKVAARVRPLSKRELEGGARSIVDVTGKQVTVWNPKLNPRRIRGCGDSRDKAKCYSFDYVYSCVEAVENVEAAIPQGQNMVATTAGQEQIFDNLGLDVLNAAFEGYNACIFAYGQTGSGKTYTMMGGPSNGVDGLIPRICQALFRKVEGQTQEVTSKVDISYMEVYNERVRDLLQSTSASRKTCLRVREHPKDGPYVQDLVRQVVTSYDAVKGLLSKGTERRATAVTHYHEHSSRSHAIFTIHFKQAKLDANLPCETVSKINLVDLAGSERADNRGLATDTDRNRLKEGANINKSLVTLASVIKALADASQVAATSTVAPGKPVTRSLAASPCFEDSEPGLPSSSTSTNSQRKSGKSVFIPYRDSVLTWLLRDSLGGNAKTIMIATISPSSWCYRETMSTLRYAQRAMSIVNTPLVNEDSHVRLIRELRTEIARLRLLLEANQSNMDSPMASLDSNSVIAKKLQQDEEMANCLYADWVDSWAETRDIMKESDVSIRRSASSSCQASGIVIDSERPHLVGMDPDILHTSIIIYNIKEGITTIGSSSSCEPSDIIIDGPGIEEKHCCLEYSLPDAQGNGGYVVLHPHSGAVCNVNGQLINDPFRLSQGDVIMLGVSRMFRFNHPSEAAELRRRRLSLADLELPIRRHHSDFELFFHGGPTMLSHSNSTSSVLTSGIDCESPSPVGGRSSVTHDGASSDSCTLWCPSSPSRTTAEDDSLTECSYSAELSSESSWTSRMLSRRHATAIWREENRLAALARRERHLAALIAAHEVLQERAHREVAAAKQQLEDERKQHMEQVRSDLQALIILGQGHQLNSKEYLQLESSVTVQAGVASATAIGATATADGGTTQATQTDAVNSIQDAAQVSICTNTDAICAEKSRLQQDSSPWQEHLKAAAQKELVLRCKEIKQESAIRALEATFTKDMMRCQQNIVEVQMQLDLLNSEDNRTQVCRLPGSKSPSLNDSDSQKLAESAGDDLRQVKVTLLDSDSRASSKNFAKECLPSITAATSVPHSASVTGTESRRYHLSPSAASVTSRLYPQKTAIHKRGSSSGNTSVIRSSSTTVGVQKTVQAKRLPRLSDEKHVRGSTKSGSTSCRPPLNRSRRLTSNSRPLTSINPILDPGRSSMDAGGSLSTRPRYVATTDTSTTDELVQTRHWSADSQTPIVIEIARSGSVGNLSEKALETITIFRRRSVCVSRSRSLSSDCCTFSPQVCFETLAEDRRSKSLPSEVMCSNPENLGTATSRLQTISLSGPPTARTIHLLCRQSDGNVSHASIHKSDCTTGVPKVRRPSTEKRTQKFQEETNSTVINDAYYTGKVLQEGTRQIAEIVPQSGSDETKSETRTAETVLVCHNGNNRCHVSNEHYGNSDLDELKVQVPLNDMADAHSSLICGFPSISLRDDALTQPIKEDVLCEVAEEIDAQFADSHYEKRLATYGSSDHAAIANSQPLENPDHLIKLSCSTKATLLCDIESGSSTAKEDCASESDTWSDDSLTEHDKKDAHPLKNKSSMAIQGGSSYLSTKSNCTSNVSTAQEHVAARHAFQSESLRNLQTSSGQSDSKFPADGNSFMHTSSVVGTKPLELVSPVAFCDPAFARTSHSHEFHNWTADCAPFEQDHEGSTCFPGWSHSRNPDDSQTRDIFQNKQSCDTLVPLKEETAHTTEVDIEGNVRQLQLDQQFPTGQICENLTTGKMTYVHAIDSCDQAGDLCIIGLSVVPRQHAPLSGLPATAAELETTHQHLASVDAVKEAKSSVKEIVCSGNTECGTDLQKHYDCRIVASSYNGIIDESFASGTMAVDECSASANTCREDKNTHSAQSQGKLSVAACFPSLIEDEAVTIFDVGGLRSSVESLTACKLGEFTSPLTNTENLQEKSEVPINLKTSRSEALCVQWDCEPYRDSKTGTHDELCGTDMMFHNKDYSPHNVAESQVKAGGDSRQPLDFSDSNKGSILHEMPANDQQRDFTVFSNTIQKFFLDQLNRAKENCRIHSSPELGDFCSPKEVLMRKDRNCVSTGGFTFTDRADKPEFSPREGYAGAIHHDSSDGCITNTLISSDFPAVNFGLESPRQLPSPAPSDASGDSLIFVYLKRRSQEDFLVDDDLVAGAISVNCFDLKRNCTTYTQKMRRFQRSSDIRRRSARWTYMYKFNRTRCLKRDISEQSFSRIRNSRTTVAGDCCMLLEGFTRTADVNDVEVALMDESCRTPSGAYPLADEEVNSVGEQAVKALQAENGTPSAVPLAFTRLLCQSDSAVAVAAKILVDNGCWMDTVSSHLLRTPSLEGLRPAVSCISQLAKATVEDSKVTENIDTSKGGHCLHDEHHTPNESVSNNNETHRIGTSLCFSMPKAKTVEPCAIRLPKVVPTSDIHLQSIAVQCDERLHTDQHGLELLPLSERRSQEVDKFKNNYDFAQPSANSCHSTLARRDGLVSDLLEHLREGADGAEKEDQLQQLRFDMQTDTADLSRENAVSETLRGLNSDSQSTALQNIPKSHERYTLGRLTFDMQTSTTTLSTCMDTGRTKQRSLSSAKNERHDLHKDPGTKVSALTTVPCGPRQTSSSVQPRDALKEQSSGTLPENGKHGRRHPTSSLLSRTRKASRQKCRASLKKRQSMRVSTAALLRMLLRATAKTCRARADASNLALTCSRSHLQLHEQSDTCSCCSDFMWYDCASVENISDLRTVKEPPKLLDAEHANRQPSAETLANLEVSTSQRSQNVSVNCEQASSTEIQTLDVEKFSKQGNFRDECCPGVRMCTDSTDKVTKNQKSSWENLKVVLPHRSLSSPASNVPICFSKPFDHDACNSHDESDTTLPNTDSQLTDTEFKTTHTSQKEIAIPVTTSSCLRQSKGDFRNVSVSENVDENSSALHSERIFDQYDQYVTGDTMDHEFTSTAAAVSKQSVAYVPSSRKKETGTDGTDDAGARIWLHSQNESRDESVETDFINPELERLRKERQHIIQLLAQGYLPSRLWQELAEAQLNYAFGQTDALLEALEEAMSNGSEEEEEEAAKKTVPLTVHESDRIVQISREYQERYKAELEISKQHIEERIRILEEEAIRAKAERVKTKNKLEILKKKRQAEIDIFKLERSRELHGSSLTRKSSLNNGVASSASESGINDRLKKSDDTFQPTSCCEKDQNNGQCTNSKLLNTDKNCLTSPKSHLRHLTRIRQNLLADEIDHAETIQNSALESCSSTQTENATEPTGEAAKVRTSFEEKEGALAVASLLYEAETVRKRSNDELRVAREAVAKSQCILTENAEKEAHRLSARAPLDEYCLSCTGNSNDHQVSSEGARSVEQLRQSEISTSSSVAITAARAVQVPLQERGTNFRWPSVLHSNVTTAQLGKSLLASSNRLAANSHERTSLAAIKTSEEIEREIDIEIERLRNSFAIVPNQRQDESFY